MRSRIEKAVMAMAVVGTFLLTTSLISRIVYSVFHAEAVAVEPTELDVKESDQEYFDSLAEPNEPEHDGTLWVDCNDATVGIGDESGYYSIELDPNMIAEYTNFSEVVSFYIGSFEEWADFEVVRDGVVGCNISQEAFLKDFPQFLYSFLGEVDPNVQYVIEWNESKEERKPE